VDFREIMHLFGI